MSDVFHSCKLQKLLTISYAELTQSSSSGLLPILSITLSGRPNEGEAIDVLSFMSGGLPPGECARSDIVYSLHSKLNFPFSCAKRRRPLFEIIVVARKGASSRVRAKIAI